MATLALDVRTNAPAVLRKVRRNIDKTADSAERLKSKFKSSIASLSSLSSVVGTMSTAMSEVGRATAALATSYVTVNSSLEQMEIMMTTATGSAEMGAQALEDMLNMSIRVPFGIEALSDSFVKLRTAGIDPMDGSLQTLVDSVAAFGGSDEQLKLVTIAIQQMVGKGVISMEELRRQFGEQVPTAIRAMASELGMEIGDMYDLIRVGGLEASRGIEALFTGLNKLHLGAAEERMKSFLGATTRLKNEWIRLLKRIGESKDSFGSVTSSVNVISEALAGMADNKSALKFVDDIGNSIYRFVNLIKDNPDLVINFFKDLLFLVDKTAKAMFWIAERFTTFTKSFVGFQAVLDGELNFFDYMWSDADSLSKKLDEISQKKKFLISGPSDYTDNTFEGAIGGVTYGTREIEYGPFQRTDPQDQDMLLEEMRKYQQDGKDFGWGEATAEEEPANFDLMLVNIKDYAKRREEYEEKAAQRRIDNALSYGEMLVENEENNSNLLLEQHKTYHDDMAEIQLKANEDAAERMEKYKERVMTPLETMNAEIAELELFAELYDMDEETFTRNMALITDDYEDAMQRIKDASDKTFKDDLLDGIKDWADDFGDTLNDMVWGAKTSFSEIAESFGRMITDMFIKRAIIAPFMSFIETSFFANGGTAVGGFQAFANGSPIVSSPTLGMVGEGKYNEAIIPLPDGRNVPVQLMGGNNGGGTGTVKVSIENSGEGKKVESSNVVFDAEGMVVSIVLEDLESNGPIRQAMGIGAM